MKKWVVGGIVAVLVIAGGITGAYAYGSHSQSRAVKDCKVALEAFDKRADVAGKLVDEFGDVDGAKVRALIDGRPSCVASGGWPSASKVMSASDVRAADGKLAAAVKSFEGAVVDKRFAPAKKLLEAKVDSCADIKGADKVLAGVKADVDGVRVVEGKVGELKDCAPKPVAPQAEQRQVQQRQVQQRQVQQRRSYQAPRRQSSGQVQRPAPAPAPKPAPNTAPNPKKPDKSYNFSICGDENGNSWEC